MAAGSELFNRSLGSSIAPSHDQVDAWPVLGLRKDVFASSTPSRIPDELCNDNRILTVGFFASLDQRPSADQFRSQSDPLALFCPFYLCLVAMDRHNPCPGGLHGLQTFESTYALPSSSP